jgi:hypothetical protein
MCLSDEDVVWLLEFLDPDDETMPWPFRELREIAERLSSYPQTALPSPEKTSL